MIFAKTPCAALVAACFCLATSAHADAVADFYRSNPIKYYVSTSPGGGYDLVSRIFVRYFPNHMPGKPSIVVINMPGAAGVTLANWTANVAPKDGTMLGMANLTVPMNQVIAPDQVRYDSTKLNWVGNLEQAILSLFTWHTSATKTMADAHGARDHHGRVVEDLGALSDAGAVEQAAQHQVQDHPRL